MTAKRKGRPKKERESQDIVSRYAERSPAAEAVSRKSRASGWRRKTDAGQAQVTGPSSGGRDGRALGGAGHDRHRARARAAGTGWSGTARVRGTVLERRERPVVDLLVAARLVELHDAHVGRLEEVAHRRIDEGQVPVLADARGWRASAAPRAGAPRSAAHSASASGASPARPWKARTGTWAKRRSTRNRRKDAGCVASTPMYSSRWKAVTRSQGMAASCAQRGQELVLRGRGREDRGHLPVALHLAPQMGRRPRRPRRAPSSGRSGCTSTASRPRMRVGVRFRVRRAAHLARGPAHEVRQRHLRLLERGMPALLPLEGDPAVVAARAQRAEHASGTELPAARQPRHPAAAALFRRLARHVLEVHVPDAVAEHGQPVRGRLSRLERVRGIPEDAHGGRGGPRAGRSACRAPRAKSPCDSIQTSTPCGRAVSPRRASASAIQPRVVSRSCPSWTRSPKTRMPGAPRRAASSIDLPASSSAAARADASG